MLLDYIIHILFWGWILALLGYLVGLFTLSPLNTIFFFGAGFNLLLVYCVSGTPPGEIIEKISNESLKKVLEALYYGLGTIVMYLILFGLIALAIYIVYSIVTNINIEV